MTDQLLHDGKFPPLSEIGGLYVIVNKKAFLTVWRMTGIFNNGNERRAYRSINADKNKPFLFLSYEVSTLVPGYILGAPVRIYKFLLDDEYIWNYSTYVSYDTLSTWVKPISVLARYNPAARRQPRNLGTKYPGNNK